jgi:hypothetical protein
VFYSLKVLAAFFVVAKLHRTYHRMGWFAHTRKQKPQSKASNLISLDAVTRGTLVKYTSYRTSQAPAAGECYGGGGGGGENGTMMGNPKVPPCRISQAQLMSLTHGLH